MFGKKRKELEDFATDLVREFSGRCPPEPPRGSPRALTLARAIDDACNRARDFQRARKLGIYGKAKLGTEFKLQLKEIGYQADFVDQLTNRLLISMSGK